MNLENILEKRIAIGWIPAAGLTYFLTYWIGEDVFLRLGYTGTRLVEVCGGGKCDTVQMGTAGYYAGLVAITAMLTVFVGYYLHFLRDADE